MRTKKDGLPLMVFSRMLPERAAAASTIGLPSRPETRNPPHPYFFPRTFSRSPTNPKLIR
jgi:hypothetical protein